MKTKCSILFFVIFLSCKVYAQDIHFSQFWAIPSYFNPGNTGLFDGDYRVYGNYRDQWGSVSVPYRTVGLSFDANNLIKKWGLSPGFSIYNDRAGDGVLNTLVLNTSLSKKWGLNASDFVSTGIEIGATQRSINFNKLSFDNQFDGIGYNPTLASNESFGNNNFFNFNANIGAIYFKKINEKMDLSTGLSISNINASKQKYLGMADVKLDRRLNFSIEPTIVYNEKISFKPGFLYLQQGRFNQFVIGSSVVYKFMDFPGKRQNIWLGAYTRMGDAFFINVGLEHNSLLFMMSYDVNYSKLREASSGRGGIEFSVRYIFRKLNIGGNKIKEKFCPVFI